MVLTDENATTTYTFYQKNFQDCVSIEIYKKILEAYTDLIFKKVLQGDDVVLPAKMGEVFIRGTKRKVKSINGKFNLPPNWKATKELREKDPAFAERKGVVYYTNEATGGVSYSFKWSKNRIPLLNKGLMSCRLTKGNKRAIKKAVDEGQEYLIY